MLKQLKRKIKLFFWNHSSKNKPMIPEGSVDTSILNKQISGAIDLLKTELKKDPEAFRKMQLYSYYNKSNFPDFNTALHSSLYLARLCNTYAFQFYIMYKLLLTELLERNLHDLDILVFGCGSMIDAVSLSFVLREYDKLLGR